MTAITQAIAVMEGLAGKTLSSTIMLASAKNYINYRDSQSLTNEQIAQKFIDAMFTRAKHQIKSAAANKANEDNMAAVQTAVDDSVADL